MQENKDLVKEALIQMKNVEEAIAENAKGILASTMKEEINQLVKESLTEEEDEVEADVEMDSDDEESDDNMDTDNEDEMDMEDDSMEMDSDEESPIDLSHIDDDEELLRVFKAMGEDDGIIVKKDGEDIQLKDNETDSEYLIKLGESRKGIKLEQKMGEMNKETLDDIVDDIFSTKTEGLDHNQEENEEVVYEIDIDDDGIETSMDEQQMEFDEDETSENLYELEFPMDDEESEDEMEFDDEESEDEMEFNDEESEDEMEFEEESYEETMESYDENSEELDEAYNHKKAKKVTVKGERKGKGPKFSYKKTTGGFNEKKKEGPKSIGTGSAKKVKIFPKGENMEVGKNKMVKKAETKEAARSLGMGFDFREGGLPKRRAHSAFNANIKKNLKEEVSMLRDKNEEYRKALNVFREKLNEVAIFNSNLAYATRLFTEHSTTKKEKINILRRFDSVESLKESKNLYKSIKDELTKSEVKSINETVETKINKQVSSGSATTLIESKTYENPQFMRMRDLMSKIG